jgi:hypothetical protein
VNPQTLAGDSGVSERSLHSAVFHAGTLSVRLTKGKDANHVSGEDQAGGPASLCTCQSSMNSGSGAGTIVCPAGHAEDYRPAGCRDGNS